jgi:hypothetical protein
MGRDRLPISCGNYVRGARWAQRAASRLELARLLAATLAWERPPGSQCHDELAKRQRVRSKLPSGLLHNGKSCAESCAGRGQLSARNLGLNSPEGCLAHKTGRRQAQGKSPQKPSIFRGMVPAKERTRSHLNFEFAPVFVVAASLEGGLFKMPLGCLTYSHR